MATTIVYKNINDIVPYENNPRNNDDAVAYVANSIKEFGFKVPVVIDKDGVIIAGHTRVKTGKKLGLKEVPCIIADDLSEEQVKAFRLADNKVGEFATWDDELLDLELDDILDIDMEDFGFDLDMDDKPEKKLGDKKGSLVEQFGVPPFSVLDTRQGYWQDRKRAWKSLGIESEKGRDETLLGEGLKQLTDTYLGGNKALQGISIFDPVLCELMYKWFCTDGGKIYDCFAGGSVRGIVASKLGYDYHGIDLRPEQVEANIQNAKDIGVEPHWYCDDSLNADKYIEDNSCDMIFSCPPYADLEVYSDDVRDISNMSYEDFCKVYKQIIDIACRKLKDNRFAVFVVGDIRDKEGFYRNFVDYTKQCFNSNGMKTYNECILVEAVGTGALRARRTFGSMRKVIKTHQNVLIFYKGDLQCIKKNYLEVFIDNIEDEDDEE